MIKKTSLIISSFVVAVMITTSCGSGSSNEASTINDSSTSNEPSAAIEASSTNEVAIGSQVWMTKNLNVDKFRNGDPIPEAKTNEEWFNAVENGRPVWSYYENDPSNGEKFGKLYNWYVVSDPRGLAPEGWHIPSDTEWIELTTFLDGEAVAGIKMKSKTGWDGNGNGNNSSNFSGLPGGYRFEFGDFENIGEYGFWWSSTSTEFRIMNFESDDLNTASGSPGRGFSVRCVKD
jgi:uncharacterized protein (TIGR02145 family)